MGISSRTWSAVASRSNAEVGRPPAFAAIRANAEDRLARGRLGARRSGLGAAITSTVLHAAVLLVFVLLGRAVP
ncbi:MAG: hypothetical protein J0H14_02020, partial [Alphaproteobacteria bacterium]|nr:hypothetical protein [Alphaproteobacteria bacterium]